MARTREWQPLPKCGLLHKGLRSCPQKERETPLSCKRHVGWASYVLQWLHALLLLHVLSQPCGYHGLNPGAYVTEIIAQYKCPEHLAPDLLSAREVNKLLANYRSAQGTALRHGKPKCQSAGSLFSGPRDQP